MPASRALVPPAPTGILVELPLAPFFLKKFRGAYCDINDLPTLDPELHRCEGVGRTKEGRACQTTCSPFHLTRMRQCRECLPCACAPLPSPSPPTHPPPPQPSCPPPKPPSKPKPHPHPSTSNLVFLKRYDGDVTDLGLTFTITDNVLGRAQEVSWPRFRALEASLVGPCMQRQAADRECNRAMSNRFHTLAV